MSGRARTPWMSVAFIDEVGDAKCALPLVGSSTLPPPLRLLPEFLGYRLQTSVTNATVEDSTAGLGQTLRTERPLVG